MFQNPEIDISKEILELLYTDKDCTPIAKPFIHQSIRVDEKDRPLQCPSCNSGINGTKEGQPDCPYCLGMGFLWDEYIVSGWFYKPNLRTASRAYGYPESVGRDLDKHARLLTLPDVYVKEGDRVFELKVDSDKNIAIPLTRYQRYSCFFSERFASDQSDSEFNVAGLQI